MTREVRACAAAALGSLALPCVYAGDVAVAVIVTKRLTKRALTPPVYHLRGAEPQAIPEAERAAANSTRPV